MSKDRRACQILGAEGTLPKSLRRQLIGKPHPLSHPCLASATQTSEMVLDPCQGDGVEIRQAPTGEQRTKCIEVNLRQRERRKARHFGDPAGVARSSQAALRFLNQMRQLWHLRQGTEGVNGEAAPSTSIPE